MQVIYNYISETDHVSRVYSVAATTCATRNVISPMKYVLYLYISTSLSMCQCPMWLFFIVP